MPILSPRRFQPRFYPVSREGETVFERGITAVEALTKGVLFGCRMCGTCILQETAFVCPMTCPKGLRNGLCGGASPERCEVDETRPCTWYKIYERAEKMGRLDSLLEINAPIDGNRAGKEQWGEVIRTWKDGGRRPKLIQVITNREQFGEDLDALFYKLRQPDWWQGDSEYHPPAYEEPVSFLEASLRTGEFIITGEIAPPLGASGDIIRKKGSMMREFVTAANFTDNASAAARMSSVASSVISMETNIEPIMQLQARDRSRVVIESDAMGAAGLGIRNILCLSGDHQRFGPVPMAQPNQFDMDAIQMLWMLRRMRDEGIYLDGRKINNPPSFFLGAAGSPFGAPPKYEAIRAEKKINAGAQFIQTQPIFDHEGFLEWLEALDKRNLLEKVYILPGLIPLKNAKGARFMADKVPGVRIPDEIVKRMEAAGEDKDKQAETGVEIALELIEKLRKTPGINGMHIMAVHWEAVVPRLVEEAGLPKPMFEQMNESVF